MEQQLRLKELRRARGLTQKDLAKRAGINRSTLAQVEVGIRRPYPKMLAAAAKALRIQMNELWSEKTKND